MITRNIYYKTIKKKRKKNIMKLSLKPTHSFEVTTQACNIVILGYFLRASCDQSNGIPKYFKFSTKSLLGS